MNNKSTIFVANWKMHMPFAHALQFCTDNSKELNAVSKQATIILCPSYEALCPVGIVLGNDTTINLGAQNCSAHIPGAYTGQVSAQSLAELGCRFCIIGHSEARTHLHETNTEIAQKMEQLLINGIIPIVCIGETEKEYKDGTTFTVLTEQLEMIFALASNPALRPPMLLIAYEPVWAIGSGSIPTREYLHKVYARLAQLCAEKLPHVDCKLLYGGSVNENTIAEIKPISEVDGYLIGGASLDFQKFKKIVSLGNK
jgi:triosephosphate isomerase